jgi:hypothetical protein
MMFARKWDRVAQHVAARIEAKDRCARGVT